MFYEAGHMEILWGFIYQAEGTIHTASCDCLPIILWGRNGPYEKKTTPMTCIHTNMA